MLQRRARGPNVTNSMSAVRKGGGASSRMAMCHKQRLGVSLTSAKDNGGFRELTSVCNIDGEARWRLSDERRPGQRAHGGRPPR